MSLGNNDEEVTEEMLERLLFQNLIDQTIDVRAKCFHCEGKGVKHGEVCEVCDGNKVIIQTKSLYKITKEAFPLNMHLIRQAQDEAQQQQQTQYGAPRVMHAGE